MNGDHTGVVPQIDPWNPGPAASRMVLGARLRTLREGLGIKRGDAGDVIRCHNSKISRMELGRHGIKDRDLRDLLDLYQVEPADRAVLLELGRQANTPGWWKHYAEIVPEWFETYLGLEQAAELIRGFENRFVPSLLQTPDYARAELARRFPRARHAEINRRVDLRLKRQQVLLRQGGPSLWLVVDEPALRRPAGDSRLMRAQLSHLLDLADRPNISLQVLPFAWGIHPAVGSPVSLLRLAAAELPDVVYLEEPHGSRYLERTEDAECYRLLLDQLGTDAAAPEDSPALLRHILET